MVRPVRVVGLGGSLRAASTSLTALKATVEGAAAAGAEVQLIWVRDLGLPLYTAEHATPARAHEFADAVYRCDAMIWSSPTYHGSVSGSFKNALDWLVLLAEGDPPYLSNKPVGLVSTAGGVQGLQAVNSMEFIARALRGWSVPLVLPVAQAGRSFDPDGHLADEAVAGQLRALGHEVVRAARQFQAEGTCDYADDRQFAPTALPCSHRPAARLYSGAVATSRAGRQRQLPSRRPGRAGRPRTRARVISVDYRLAPEHPYPAAVDDALAACQALLQAGTDPGRHRVRRRVRRRRPRHRHLGQRPRPRAAQPAAAFVMSPYADLTLVGASMDTRRAADPLLSRGTPSARVGDHTAGHDPLPA